MFQFRKAAASNQHYNIIVLEFHVCNMHDPDGVQNFMYTVFHA